MNIPNYDSRTADKFVARLPDGLRADIEAAASASDRSMNSVFVQAVRQYLDGQRRQQLLLDALASASNIPAVGDAMHIDDRVKLMADPRDLFIAANPIGANNDELSKGRSGFVDERTHADYLIFLAGYRAAIKEPEGTEVQP
ncbi:CopG family ribbon-helix-helix protein [Pseudomonas sp. Z4-20]|uniref:CopG family ribbon-helix-helix protein n=1 Tax=Pseudomonas sp. Z4-20 TaxID=2817414 RepID=UPI003DA88FD6